VAAVLREPGEGAAGTAAAGSSGESWRRGCGLHPAGREGPSCRVLSAGTRLLSRTCVRNHGGMVLVLSGQVNAWELGWEMGLQVPEMEREGGTGCFPASALPKDSCHGLERS